MFGFVVVLASLLFGAVLVVLRSFWSLQGMLHQQQLLITQMQDQIKTLPQSAVPTSSVASGPESAWGYPHQRPQLLPPGEVTQIMAKCSVEPHRVSAEQSAMLVRNVPEGIIPLLSAWLQSPAKPYSFVLGVRWAANGPRLVTASFHNNAGASAALHPLVTGKTGSGKDTMVFVWLISLLMRHGPEDVRVCLISKKKQEIALWKNKQHVWGEPASDDESIAKTLHALEAELDRREQVLADHERLSWESYRKDFGDLPLLIVVVSELDYLKKDMGQREFDTWMSAFISRCRSAGIRLIISTNSVNNQSTGWRKDTGLIAAGQQNSGEHDRPNIGMLVEQVHAKAALLPSEIPAPGIFTVRLDRQMTMVTLPKLDDADWVTALKWLPDRSEAAPTVAVPVVVPQPQAGIRPFDLLSGGMKPEELALHPVVRAAVKTVYQSLPLGERSGRKLCDVVFETQPGLKDGFTGARHQKIIMPIVQALGLQLDTKTSDERERSTDTTALIPAA